MAVSDNVPARFNGLRRPRTLNYVRVGTLSDLGLLHDAHASCIGIVSDRCLDFQCEIFSPFFQGFFRRHSYSLLLSVFFRIFSVHSIVRNFCSVNRFRVLPFGLTLFIVHLHPCGEGTGVFCPGTKYQDESLLGRLADFRISPAKYVGRSPSWYWGWPVFWASV